MAAIWMDLCIDLKQGSKPIWAPELRRIIAKQNATETDKYWKVDPAIFHHINLQTNTDLFPPFRITTTQQGQSAHIFAVGQEAVEYLMANGHKITRFIGKHIGRSVPEHRYSGTYEVRELPYLKNYFIPTLVFQKSKRDYLQFKEAARKNELTPVIEKKIDTLIKEGLFLHCENLGIYIDEFTLGDVSVEYFVPIKVKANRYNLAAVNVSFRCSLDISKGIFHVGYLKARGYGRIMKSYKKQEVSNVAAG